MASATTTNGSNILTDLGLEKLSQGVSLYNPARELKTSAPSTDPTLIIICAWAFAQPKHIAKYIQPYQELYRGASILLVQNVVSNVVWKLDSWQTSFFQPAAIAIQAHLRPTNEPRVLLHVFSNGGSHAAVQLAQICRETCGGMSMPVDAMLLDSCPGQPRFMPTINALVGGIPSKNLIIKGVATALAYASVGGTALFDVLNILESAAWKLYRRLNDPSEVFLLKPENGEKKSRRLVPRVYLYSQSDTMIMSEDVLGHARIAREKLQAIGIAADEAAGVVQLEEFEGTAHVNHVKTESQRYWTIVQSTWNKTTIP